MPGNQVNVEYWYRLLYECLRGGCHSDLAWLVALLSRLWIWIIYIGYILAILGLFAIIYILVRLFDLREREDKFYKTLLVEPEAEQGSSARWRHIETLAGGTTPSEWKEAIIEADIMLDEMLTNQGYVGVGPGEKLKAADPEHFHTLQEAWDAHKVRNQIAHEGSAFTLSDTLAKRTIARYAAVFREFKVI